MEIERVVTVSDEVIESLGKLMIQLSPTCTPLTKAHLQEILDLTNVYLFIAKQDEQIIGTFTLVLYKIPTGTKATIEDVVVDASKRGQKIGEKLMVFAIEYAKTQLKVAKVDLTSSPSRVAANTLYQKMGFAKRKTNVYRFSLK